MNSSNYVQATIFYFLLEYPYLLFLWSSPEVPNGYYKKQYILTASTLTLGNNTIYNVYINLNYILLTLSLRTPNMWMKVVLWLFHFNESNSSMTAVNHKLIRPGEVLSDLFYCIVFLST